MFLGKLALGLGGTILLAGAYAFHDGVARISVDEHKWNGEHHHLMIPATLIPVAVHLVPHKAMERAAENAAPWLPAVRKMAKELRKLPDTDLVEFRDAEQHVQLRTRSRRLQIDVDSPKETVHILCPLVTIEDVSSELELRLPRG